MNFSQEEIQVSFTLAETGGRKKKIKYKSPNYLPEYAHHKTVLTKFSQQN